MKRTIHILTVIAFVGFLCFMGYQTLMKDAVAYSAYEYRNLTQKPSFSFKSVMQGKYTQEFESYFQDQFYKRIGISKSFYLLQLKMGKPVVSNALVGEDGWARFVPSSGDNEMLIDHSITEINQLNEFADANDIPMYLSINPYKDITLEHVFPYHPYSNRGTETKEEVLNGLGDSVQVIDNAGYFKRAFSNEQLETMFYKTDHHWNHLGAYETYKNLIRTLQKNHPEISDPVSKDELKLVEAERDKVCFTGSTNRSLLRALSEKEEPVSAYTVADPDVYSEVYSINYSGNKTNGLEKIFHTQLNASEQTYAGLTSGDFPQVVLKTKNPPNDYKVLIVKDSYTNAMLPYMGIHFKETHVLDMRYYKEGTVQDYVKEQGINLIILSHNETMTGDTFSYSGNRVTDQFK